jgi:hypothetical protein
VDLRPARYLLTGEYDFSCTPEDTRLTAEKIPGARFTLMTEIGHFPMAENPAQFRRYLLPVLDEIRGQPPRNLTPPLRSPASSPRRRGRRPGAPRR